MSDKKLNLQEHVEALFEGVEVSAEEKTRMETVLEAAITSILSEEEAKMEAKIAEIKESVEVKANELTEARVVEINAQVSKYLDHVISEWVEENRVALETGSKVEMAESFLSGMIGLVAEHNVTIPEGGENLLESAEKELAELRESVNSLQAKNIELEGELNSRTRSDLIAEASEGLADTQKEKFNSLVEDIEFSNSETFAKKLSVVRESYFKGSEEKSEPKNESLNEEAEMTPAELRLHRIRNPYSS